MKLKEFYVNEYQEIVYRISVTKAEFDKILSFASISLILLTALKVYFPIIPWWVLPTFLLGVTVWSYWIGGHLIRLGVPKKTAELSNLQNPQMVQLLEKQIEILNLLKK